MKKLTIAVEKKFKIVIISTILLYCWTLKLFDTYGGAYSSHSTIAALIHWQICEKATITFVSQNRLYLKYNTYIPSR